jgi:hypothetical protein
VRRASDTRGREGQHTAADGPAFQISMRVSGAKRIYHLWLSRQSGSLKLWIS